MSEQPGRSLHPISETDEEMTTRSRAWSPAWKIINHHMGGKIFFFFSESLDITNTRKEKEQTKKRKNKKTFLVFESDSHTLHTTIQP